MNFSFEITNLLFRNLVFDSVRYFSKTTPKSKIVGHLNNKDAKSGKPVPFRIRKANDSRHGKFHPIVQKITDEKKLYAVPRCSDSVVKFEYRQLFQLKRKPEYAAYFEPGLGMKRNVIRTEDEIRNVVWGGNAYDTWDYLIDTDFSRTTTQFRKETYEELWNNSVGQTPTDLPRLLSIISTWLRIGVKPGNLFTAAFELLPDQRSREALVLCAFYKAIGYKLSMPRDDVILPVLEDFLLAEGSTLSMIELVMISDGFFRSYAPFRFYNANALCNVVQRRFLELLHSHRWTLDEHTVFKVLKMNNHWDLASKQEIHPALEAAGFFDFCLENPRHGMHDLMILTSYLYSRRFRDEKLLSQCVETLRLLSKKDDAFEARSKDFARLCLNLACLGVEMDEEIVDFLLSFFRRSNQATGVSLFIFLDGLAISGLFPHDLIHALFSSDKFMRVENGRMTGMGHGDDKSLAPLFEELLRYDFSVEAFCTDYAGARLPKEVKLAAQAYKASCAPIIDQGREQSLPGEYQLADELNDIFNKSRRNNPKKYVTVTQPVPTLKTYYIVMLLDEFKNRPLVLNPENLEKLSKPAKGTKKVCIDVLLRNSHLQDYFGVPEERVTPIHRYNHAILEKYGFEIIIVNSRDAWKLEDETFRKELARNLAKKITDSGDLVKKLTYSGELAKKKTYVELSSKITPSDVTVDDGDKKNALFKDNAVLSRTKKRRIEKL